MREERLCRLCLKDNVHKVEDEFHMLLECPTYSDLRKIYLDNVASTPHAYCSLFMSNESVFLTNLGNFICSAFAVRSKKLDSVS